MYVNESFSNLSFFLTLVISSSEIQFTITKNFNLFLNNYLKTVYWCFNQRYYVMKRLWVVLVLLNVQVPSNVMATSWFMLLRRWRGVDLVPTWYRRWILTHDSICLTIDVCVIFNTFSLVPSHLAPTYKAPCSKASLRLPQHWFQQQRA